MLTSHLEEGTFFPLSAFTAADILAFKYPYFNNTIHSLLTVGKSHLGEGLSTPRCVCIFYTVMSTADCYSERKHIHFSSTLV